MIRHTENISDLSAALVAASAELTGVSKSREASIPTKSGGSYGYRYAALEDVLDTVRPVLAKHGLTVTQTASNRSEDYLTISTAILHKSGQYLLFEPLALPNGRTAQEIGSAITYGRRYHLLACLGLAASDDDDGASAAPRPTLRDERTEPQQDRTTFKPQPGRAASPKQLEWIGDLITKHKFDAAIPVDLSFDDASEAIDLLKKKILPPRFGLDVAEDYEEEEPF